MPRVIATHAVGNMNTWLAGSGARGDLHAVLQRLPHLPARHREQGRARLENADLQKLEAALAHPDTEKAKARHTVLEPIDLYVEVEGGR